MMYVIVIVICVQCEWPSPGKSRWQIHTSPDTCKCSQSKADITGDLHGSTSERDMLPCNSVQSAKKSSVQTTV